MCVIKKSTKNTRGRTGINQTATCNPVLTVADQELSQVVPDSSVTEEEVQIPLADNGLNEPRRHEHHTAGRGRRRTRANNRSRPYASIQQVD